MNDDLVAVLDTDTQEYLFQGANPMRITVRDEQMVTRFPVEDGTERSDHIVKLNKEIMIDFLLTDDSRLLYAALKQAKEEARLLTIQTRLDSYESMVIESLPHDEFSTDSAIPVNIALIEWIPVVPQYEEAPMRKSNVKDGKQATTVKRGQQTTTTPDAPKQRKASVAHGLFN